MRRVVIFTVLVFAIGAAVSAVADELISRRAVTIDMAQCAVRRDPLAAKRFVLANFPANSDVMPPELKAARQRIVQTLTPCLGRNFRSVTMTEVQLRGFLAEGLLTEDSAILLDRARQLPAIQLTSGPSGNAGAAFWTCVVDAAPRQTADLIATSDGSPLEAPAFDALGTTMQGCVATSRSLHIKPGNVRPQVAAALYRRLVVSTASGDGS